jgi:hypothetical protein
MASNGSQFWITSSRNLAWAMYEGIDHRPPMVLVSVAMDRDAHPLNPPEFPSQILMSVYAPQGNHHSCPHGQCLRPTIGADHIQCQGG